MNPLRETNDEQLLSRYLLEDLREEERERFEEGYLSDDDLYMKLLVAEDELIAAYLQGELSRADRLKFERAYLTNPHKRRKVEATKELLNFFAEKTPPAPGPGLLTSLLQRLWGGGWKPIYAFAGILLFAVSCALLCWLLVERQRMQDELKATQERLRQAESERQQMLSAQTPTPTPVEVRDAPPAPLRAGSTPEHTPGASGGRETQEQKRHDRPIPQGGSDVESTSSAVLAFALPRPGPRTRGGSGGGTRPLVIPRGVVLVRLSVKVGSNDYAAYDVSIQKLGGREVLRQTIPKNGPGASGGLVNVELPASLLTKGDYILKVTGGEQILAFNQISVVK